MKYWHCLLLLTFLACKDQQPPVDNTDTVAVDTTQHTTVERIPRKEISWSGTLHGNIPVFLHYQQDTTLLIGEIIYLNTKDKLPNKLIGTMEDDSSYRLLEFEPSGNITGIITGTPTSKTFNGTWFSPKTRKELTLHLSKKDTSMIPAPLFMNFQDIFGHYHYQYSEAGYQGDFTITQLRDDQAVIGITAVTGEPARNLAQINEDTVKLLIDTDFNYKKPGTDNCEFRVKFYPGFVYVKYTKGFCEGQFGHNATVEGIYLKTK
ncbi:hypothetical protein [Paraflavitalea pollutisoli]|uniref:hypothetical protein n=1 Tax=Paraflavitalea pollutisoli TaxID=3034143 RepID=UPI0023EB9D5C|nr:hypothetical protein [Paraflavitalea sp. H1-2-19X]